MKTSMAMLTASMATAILAHPFDTRSQQCNVAPSASTNANIKPISQPSASTAEACLKACSSNSSCKSFLFGLPADASTPVCKLYSVEASRVPKQNNELYVFDKACSGSKVPQSKPTHDEPRGKTNSKVAARGMTCNAAPTAASNSNVKPFATPSAETADKCQDACDAQSGCQSFVFGLPDDASTPVCKLYKVAPAQVPQGDDQLYVFAKGCPAAQVPTSAPTHAEPRGKVPSEKADAKTGAKTETKSSAQKAQAKTGNQAKANQQSVNSINPEQKHN
ncbi:uncharacterized protein B0J16DRAFT_314724 [Fusarium flagelliforme]|uniref:Apple domain-containing protein n=1 Tax=Fusarium flagelliforme TaxID=2675880 RepID=A0A395N4X6_9HYPO|nr:uncharacterized protein B0J16DRAFT_314724 [Fusarium flagelliforme]KAH7198419.1 hypothetical protein B0J16DRAFT_314724 [Fusarium flagelliforme]RFN55182.1 hypothetical protein FIE12Z_435 [Fusarium flagelliforme]